MFNRDYSFIIIKDRHNYFRKVSQLKGISVKNLSFLLCAIFSSSLQAAETLSDGTVVLEWFKHNQFRTMSMKYDDSSQATGIGVETRISHAKEGVQRLYFNLQTLEESSFCDKDKTTNEVNVENRIVKIDAKAIKMVDWCKPFGNKGGYLMQFTPLSDQAINYVLNRFKKSPKHVQFEFRHYSLPISALGFTKAWNESGGNAL